MWQKVQVTKNHINCTRYRLSRAGRSRQKQIRLAVSGLDVRRDKGRLQRRKRLGGTGAGDCEIASLPGPLKDTASPAHTALGSMREYSSSFRAPGCFSVWGDIHRGSLRLPSRWIGPPVSWAPLGGGCCFEHCGNVRVQREGRPQWKRAGRR